MPKQTVLFVFPTEWDSRQLAHCAGAWQNDFTTLMAEPCDADCAWDFDIIGHIDALTEQYRGRIDGVTSSSDYPGATVAGAVATRLGLPGSAPHVIIGCSHKYYSRLAQRNAVPEATPAFHLVDPDSPEASLEAITFPCFLKPVKGAFSVMARKINSPDELRAFFERPAAKEFSTAYIAIFNRLVEELTELDIDGRFFLAESFLHGTQVTVEGYVHRGSVEILGIVDSVMYPGTGSFARFDYPSAIRPEVQHWMVDIARRTMNQLGLENSLFNIEMIYEPSRDTVHIIEVNPRMCGQFADLYEKVDGTNAYRVALDLAVGRTPELTRGAGRYKAATSFALRTFERVAVRRVPDATRISEVESRYSDTIIWWECAEGQDLGEFERIEDGSSYRYAVINLGANSRDEMNRKRAAVERDLEFELERL